MHFSISNLVGGGATVFSVYVCAWGLAYTLCKHSEWDFSVPFVTANIKHTECHTNMRAHPEMTQLRAKHPINCEHWHGGKRPKPCGAVIGMKMDPHEYTTGGRQVHKDMKCILNKCNVTAPSGASRVANLEHRILWSFWTICAAWYNTNV